MLLVACGPTGVPGAGGPGRPRDRHTARPSARSWSISKPGQALPPPTGTSARLRGPRGPRGLPSMREPAARSHRARSPAKPSGPSGTLHTGGAIHCCAHPIQDPPPTGAAANAPQPGLRGPRGSLQCANLRLGVVDLEARPSPPDPPAPSTPVGLFIAVHIPSRPRRPRALRPSPTARPLLSRSSRVALHTGGAWCAGG